MAGLVVFRFVFWRIVEMGWGVVECEWSQRSRPIKAGDGVGWYLSI